MSGWSNHGGRPTILTNHYQVVAYKKVRNTTHTSEQLNLTKTQPILFFLFASSMSNRELYRKTVKSCISQSSKTAKIKMFINYKREIYALTHLNLSTASFKCLS